MGERGFQSSGIVAQATGALREVGEQGRALSEMRGSTPGGNYPVRWDDTASATVLGQLAFFAEFLDATGLFERFYQSPGSTNRGSGLGLSIAQEIARQHHGEIVAETASQLGGARFICRFTGHADGASTNTESAAPAA